MSIRNGLPTLGKLPLISSSGISSSVTTISIFDDVYSGSFRNTGNTFPLGKADCPEIQYYIYLPKIFNKIKHVGNTASIPNLILVNNNTPIRKNNYRIKFMVCTTELKRNTCQDAVTSAAVT
jgi:hypothetical protein